MTIPDPAALALDAALVLIRHPFEDGVHVRGAGGFIEHRFYVVIVQHEPANVRVSDEAQFPHSTVSRSRTMDVMVERTDQSARGQVQVA